MRPAHEFKPEELMDLIDICTNALEEIASETKKYPARTARDALAEFSQKFEELSK